MKRAFGFLALRKWDLDRVSTAARQRFLAASTGARRELGGSRTCQGCDQPMAEGPTAMDIERYAARLCGSCVELRDRRDRGEG
jgi:hypothetical protein